MVSRSPRRRARSSWVATALIRRRIDVADRLQGVDRRELLERVGRASREQVIEHDAERIDVARRRHTITAHLFGAGVFGREAVIPGARRLPALASPSAISIVEIPKSSSFG